MDGGRDGWMDGWIDGKIDRRIDSWKLLSNFQPHMLASCVALRPRASWRHGMHSSKVSQALSYESSMVVPLHSVAGPFLRPWQQEVWGW